MASVIGSPGVFTSTAKSRKGGRRSGCSSRPPLEWGFMPMRRLPLGGKIGDVRQQAAVGVEELFGFVAAHPVFEDFQVAGFFVQLGEGDLMGAPGAFDGFAVDDLRAGPALWEF